MMGLVGLGLLFVRNGKLQVELLFKFIVSTAIGALLIWMVYTLFFESTLSLSWAFELIINYMDSGKLETASTNDLKTLFIYPDNESTWIFGDGKFVNADGSYYKHTDVGFLRIIYGLGLIGLFVFIVNQVYLMKCAIKYSPANQKMTPLVLVLAVYLIILNIKGYVELNYFFYMLIGFLIYNRKKLIYGT